MTHYFISLVACIRECRNPFRAIEIPTLLTLPSPGWSYGHPSRSGAVSEGSQWSHPVRYSLSNTPDPFHHRGGPMATRHAAARYRKGSQWSHPVRYSLVFRYFKPRVDLGGYFKRQGSKSGVAVSSITCSRYVANRGQGRG